MMKLLNGSEIADFVKERQAKQVRSLRQSQHIIPKIVVIQAVDSPVVDTYVRLKRRYADDIGIVFELKKVKQSQVEDVIQQANSDTLTHGVILQLPLADPSQTDDLVRCIAPEKDVDGLGVNPAFDPATALAINWLLAAYNVDVAHKAIAIVGHGRLVGAPLAKLWKHSGYEVTVFDEHTVNLADSLVQFPVIITATGVPRLIQSTMVQFGAVVVDAGTASENGVIVGDVDEDLRQRDDVTITPVIGGVGPLTIAALLDNVLTAARRAADAASD